MKKASNTASIMTAGKTNNNSVKQKWNYADPKSFKPDKSGQVRLTGLNQSAISEMVVDILYYKDTLKLSDKEIADIFPPITSYDGKKKKDGTAEENVSDGNHRIKAFIEAGITKIRYSKQSHSSEHAKIKYQIGQNLHPATTALNKRNRIHSLRSYMAKVDADKSINGSSDLFPLKGFAKKMDKNSDKALSDASQLVEKMFRCKEKTAKEYLSKAVVVDDPKQRSLSRKELFGVKKDAFNKKYGIERPSSASRGGSPSNNYAVITVFNSGYLWNNALASAYKIKSKHPKCNIILRIADDGRGNEHIDTFREDMISEVNSINNSDLLKGGKALFDIVQVAPQKTGYEDPSLEEIGFFEVPDANRLDRRKKPNFDWKSTPKGGWNTITGISEEEVQEYLLSIKK